MEIIRKTKGFIKECSRVLKSTKKPSGTEFKAIVKVSGIGTLIIGTIGFIILVLGKLII